MVYSCRTANTLQKFLSSLGAKTRKSKSLKQGLEEVLEGIQALTATRE